MENMWLAAQSLGLGGVWLGVATEEDRMTMVEKILPIAEGQRAFAIFPMGYPAKKRSARQVQGRAYPLHTLGNGWLRAQDLANKLPWQG